MNDPNWKSAALALMRAAQRHLAGTGRGSDLEVNISVLKAMEAREKLRPLREGIPDCPPRCGHSAMEHVAFDAGLMAGQRGDPEGTNPFHLLSEAWLSGHSVGRMNKARS